jgi:hypothetical protein
LSPGTQTAGALPALLRQVHIGRKSGVLRVECGDEHHTLRFVQGQVVDVASSVPELSLLQLLVARGLLEANLAAQIAEAAARDHEPLLCVVRDRGVVEAAQLDQARADQVRAVIQRVAEWTEGTHVFEEGDSAKASDVVPGVSTGDLILAAIAGLKDANVARYTLGDLDRILVLSTDPLLRFQKITLKPTEGYLLSRIDGTLSARQVAQLVPASPDEIVRGLFGLHCAGLVEFLDVSVPAARPTHAAPPATQSAPPSPTSEVPSETTRAASPATGPAKTATETDIDARRHQDVLDFHRDLKAKDHFEILGLAHTATEPQVREAYFQLARRYHPDVYRGPAFADVSDKIEAILVRLGEAFEVLKDPKRRGKYEAHLASKMPRQAAGERGATSVSGPSSAGDSAIETKLADEAVRKAEQLCLAEKYWDAIQAVEPQVTKARGKMRVRARLVLARCYLKNPNWVKRAEEQLNLALEEDPKDFDAHYLLGTLYLSGGLRSRALSKFRKVLELKPEHEEARARVAELAPPPEPTPPASGGFMKRIFGKNTEE